MLKLRAFVVVVGLIALSGCGETIDTIEDDVEASLAGSTPVEDVDCPGYTEEDVPEEGTRLSCPAFRRRRDPRPQRAGGRGHSGRRPGRVGALPPLPGSDRTGFRPDLLTCAL